MTDTVDCAVIGAGVVGLAVAGRLAQSGLDTIVLEKASIIGSETSSRNSEVIHAGIYYSPGSLKARLCVQGREMLYAYCQSHQVSHDRCGKLIVATSESQLEALKEIQSNAVRNGVSNLELLNREQARALEPALACHGALHSPSTGIIDSHGLMLALQGDLERVGGMIAFDSPVISGAIEKAGIRLQTGGSAGMEFIARHMVNCGGLHAQAIARKLDGFPAAFVPPAHLARGNYYSLNGRAPFSRLIYPVPQPGGLGVHLTLDLGGSARFGPDVEWIEQINYDVDPRRSDAFYQEIRRYWPELPDDSLSPDYAGIRPKISGPGEAAADFLIQGPADHGVPGLINLFGIESPGLTASLAIAAEVDRLISGTGQPD